MLIILQVVLISIGFNKIVFNPNSYLFANDYDGVKNYFTLNEYIAQKPSSKGLLHFTQMNYPYGEYVFYTDNSPILSVPLKWLNLNVIHIEPYSIGIYNYIFLILILLSSVVLFFLLKDYLQSFPVLHLIFSTCLIWINPQLLRLQIGHFNLSVAAILLLLLLLFKKIVENNDGFSVKHLKYAILFYLLTVVTSFLHLYYLALIGLPLALFISLIFIYEFITSRRLNFVVFIYGIPFLLAVATVFFTIQWIDLYYNERNTIAQGLGYFYWNMIPEAVFTAYNFIDFKLVPPFATCSEDNIKYESYAFLGNFTIYVWLLAILTGIYFIYSKKISASWFLKKLKENKYLFIILMIGFFSYATAIGFSIKTCLIPLSTDNWLNPLYYLRSLDMISQFRCLGRFSFIAFWGMSFFAVFYFIKINDVLKSRKQVKASKFLTLIFIFILMSDTFAFIKLYNNKVAVVNTFNDKYLEKRFSDLDAVIDFEEYQALLTIPPTHVGSENFSFTIEDDIHWTKYWFQLGSYSGLPNFNCKMSRTSVEQAQSQVQLFSELKVSEKLENQLNNKPILVVFNPAVLNNIGIGAFEPASIALKQSPKIIEAFKMDTLLIKEGVYYFKWELNKTID